MTITTSNRAALVGGALLALGLVAGCGSSHAATGSGTPTKTPAPTASATAGAEPSASVDAKVCAAVANDVAAITSNVSSPTTYPGQCAFGTGATTISFNLDDPQHKDVTAAIPVAHGHPIHGIGDGGIWYDGIGGVAPSLGAWKGSTSCLVQPDGDIANDKLKYTGKGRSIKIAAADAAAYAQRLGAICTDVFHTAG